MTLGDLLNGRTMPIRPITVRELLKLKGWQHVSMDIDDGTISKEFSLDKINMIVDYQPVQSRIAYHPIVP